MSNGQAENGDDAVHRLVLPSDRACPIGGAVPVARAGRVQTGADFLHDRTGHHVLEGLLQLAEGREDRLGDGRAPVVDLLDLIGVVANDSVNRFPDHLVHFLRYE